MRKLFLISLVFSLVIASENVKIVKEDSVFKNMFDKKLKEQNRVIVKMAAEEMRKHLPQKVDKYTTLVSANHKDTTLIYIYELNVPKKSDEDLKKEGEKRLEAQIKRHSCISSKRFLKSDINLSYVYKSAKTKKTLFQIDVSKKDCQRLW